MGKKVDDKFDTKAILGYRIFRIGTEYDDPHLFNKKTIRPYLRSLYMNDFWEPDVNIAKCSKERLWESKNKHSSSPDQDCHCGLQAYYSLGTPAILSPNFFNGYAIACVAGAGEVLLHRDGWRASQAQVIALYMPAYEHYRKTTSLWQEERERQTDPSLTTGERLQEELAEIYGVPLIRSRKEFTELGPRLGLKEKRRARVKAKGGLIDRFRNRVASMFRTAVSDELNNLNTNYYRKVSAYRSAQKATESRPAEVLRSYSPPDFLLNCYLSYHNSLRSKAFRSLRLSYKNIFYRLLLGMVLVFAAAFLTQSIGIPLVAPILILLWVAALGASLLYIFLSYKRCKMFLRADCGY